MAEGEVFVLLRMRCESQGDAIEGAEPSLGKTGKVI